MAQGFEKNDFHCRFLNSSLQNHMLAQAAWDLQRDGGWIKIYTRAAVKSNIKEVRVLCTLNATTSQLANVIRDIPSYSNWVYSNKKSEILKGHRC